MTIQLSMFGAKYDGKQADLFVAPVSTTAPAVPLPHAEPDDVDLDKELDEAIPIPEGRWIDGRYLVDGETKAPYEQTFPEFVASSRRQYPGGKCPNGMTTSDEDCRTMYDACQHANQVVQRREAAEKVKASALVFSFGGVEIHRQELCAECGDPLPPKAKACPNCYTKVAKGDT